MTDKKRIETICVTGGYEPKRGEPRQIPIIQSTTFKYDSAQDLADLFDLKEAGYFYSRVANPTNDNVAKRIAELEGGVGAILTSSGQAAAFYAFASLLNAGDHIIVSSEIYGGTFNLIKHTLKNFGIESSFVDPNISEEDLGKEFKENTKAVFGETISNPSLNVLDIEKFAKVSHKNGLPLIVDNTFATPIFLRPFEWGADIVVHSTTKYMNGSANAVGGVIVDSGNFDWTKYADKYPSLTKADETYHGLVFTEAFGKAAYITKITTTLMRDLGATPSPQNSFYLNLGLETLHLRMPRAFSNALKIAEFLQNHPKISWVSFPSLKGDKQYQLAQKYLANGSTGVLSFGVKGGREASIKVLYSLKLIAIATHVADLRTIALHPASSTHRQMNDQELKEAGVKADLVRLSVGIENVDDLIEDLEQALEQI